MSDKSKSEGLSIWLMAFSVACIGLLVWRMTSFWHTAIELELVVSLVLLGLIFVLGFYSLTAPKESHRWLPILTSGRAFLSAWKMLWNRKWLLYLFASIFLVGLADASLSFALQNHYLRVQKMDLTYRGLASGSGDMQLSLLASAAAMYIPGAVELAPKAVFPSFGTAANGVGRIVLSLVVLALAFWVTGRLKTLMKDPMTRWNARSVLALLAPAVIVYVAAVLSFEAVSIRTMTKGMTGPGVGTSLFPTLLTLNALPLSLVLWPLAMSGIAGSLKRTAGGRPITGDSFILDAVRFFKPMAGLFLVLWLAEELLGNSLVFRMVSIDNAPLFSLLTALIFLLLAFAPFAIVIRGLGLKEGLRRGICAWRERTLVCLTFAALGVTLAVASTVLGESLRCVLAPSIRQMMGVGGYAWTAAYLALDTLAAAVMLIAVWNLSSVLFEAGEPEPQIIGAEQGSA